MVEFYVIDESKPALVCCRLLVMGKYDERLLQLAQSPIIAQLEGSGGLLALSSQELFYLDNNTQQMARLAQIKRISVNKQTGTVDVMSDQGTLMAIAPTAFQKEELKLFLESLKGHVLRAKSEAAQAEGASKAETPRPAPEVHTPQPTPQEAPPAAETPPPPPANQIHITEPAKTLPDEPADSLWAYDASPKPAAATEDAVPKGTPTTPAQELPSAASMPPSVPAASKGLSPTQRIISVLLKVSALITAVVTVGYLVVNMGLTNDIWVPLGVIAIGLSLALIQWRLSEPC